jgi:hypothetical protein
VQHSRTCSVGVVHGCTGRGEAEEKRESAMCCQTLRGAAVGAVWHGGPHFCSAGRSKRRRWNDNCTGRTCSKEPATPLEPPAISQKEAAAEARQMERKRNK